jgi:4-hydroxybutyrate CoA-transferase
VSVSPRQRRAPGWHDEYQRKLRSADEAVRLVRDDHLVVVTGRNLPGLLEKALADRLAAGDLRRIRLLEYGLGARCEQLRSLPTCVVLSDARGKRVPSVPSTEFKAMDERGVVRPDVVMTVLSPPDDDGYCSFGHYLSNKRALCRRAGTVIAEVNDQIIHTGREASLHISQVDAFVLHRSPLWEPEAWQVEPPSQAIVKIAGLIADLVRDGDTVEVGIGATVNYLHLLGVFKGKRDLGMHTGATRPGLVADMQAGIFTGARKSYDPGLLVTAAFYPQSDDDLRYLAKNIERFAFRDLATINNITAVAAHENFVAINSAMAVDLSGQISAESEFGEGGGLTGFAIGAVLSRGGRSIIALPSTARGGEVSRITARLAPGQGVTVPRQFADIVVTEHGVAHLLGRPMEERARALIAIADPQFRKDLKAEARRMGIL